MMPILENMGRVLLKSTFFIDKTLVILAFLTLHRIVICKKVQFSMLTYQKVPHKQFISLDLNTKTIGQV